MKTKTTKTEAIIKARKITNGCARVVISGTHEDVNVIAAEVRLAEYREWLTSAVPGSADERKLRRLIAIEERFLADRR